MATLLVSPPYSKDDLILWDTAVSQKYTAQRLQKTWRMPMGDAPVALYGEPSFVIAAAKEFSLALLETPVYWLCQLPVDFVKRQVEYALLAMLNTTPIEFPVFVKPTDDKCFPAGVYQSMSEIPGIERLSSPKYVPSIERLSTSTPILISELVSWQLEFRAFILEQACVTMSLYARDGQLTQASDGSWPAADEAELKAAQAFLTSLLNHPEITLPAAVVIDIGLIADKGWAVIDANPVWSSELYGCDPVAALRAITRGCPPKKNLSIEDENWIRATS